MKAYYLESLREKIATRYRRLMDAKFNMVHSEIRRCFGFLTSNELVFGIMRDLETRNKDVLKVAKEIVEQGKTADALVEDLNAALSLLVLWLCSKSEKHDIEIEIGSHYIQHLNHEVHIDYFRSYFVRPLFDYLLEQLDEQTALLGVLTRYKKRCEWFQRDRLYAAWETNRTKGEDALAFDLYQYLHDAGIQLSIEARSISGKADLIASQTGELPVLADVKVFSDTTSPSYLASGVTQVYQYTTDHNYPVGYLIIFNVSGRRLNLCLSQQEGNIPFMVHNHKTIHLLEVDVTPREVSASKMGKMAAIDVTEEQLAGKAI